MAPDATNNMRRKASLGKRTFVAAIVAFALFMSVVTIAAFNLAVTQLNHTARSRFDALADQSMHLIQRRYESASTMLKSMRALFDASEDVSAHEFDTFVVSSGFVKAFPDFGAIGFIPRVPAAEKDAFLKRIRSMPPEGYGFPDFAITPYGERDEYWPTMYTYPTTVASQIAGFDQASDPVRAANIVRARDTGDVSISDDVILRSSQKQGALMVAPLYRTRNVPETVEARRDAFAGVVAISFAYEDFPLGAIPPDLLSSAGIGVSVAGQDSKFVPFARSAPRASVFARLYGPIQERRLLALNQNDSIVVRFDGAAFALLTPWEMAAPFGISLTLVVITAFACLLLLLFRRNYAYNDLRQRYDFVSSISHQLRTPITKMRWSIESFATQAGVEGDDVLGSAMGDIISLNTIVDELLLFLEWGAIRKLSGGESAVPVSDLIADVNAKMKQLHHDVARIRVTLGASGAELVKADRKKLSTAIGFLVDNALVYSPKDRQIDIDAIRDGDIIEIAIRDRGIGIPKNEQEKVWEYFFRASNASLEKNAGSGVGIPLAKTIVEAHGGTVRFTSEENVGTTFFIRLPRTKAEAKK